MTITTAHATKLKAAGLTDAQVAQMKALAPTFDWTNLLNLLITDGPAAVAIIIQIINALGATGTTTTTP